MIIPSISLYLFYNSAALRSVEPLPESFATCASSLSASHPSSNDASADHAICEKSVHTCDNVTLGAMVVRAPYVQKISFLAANVGL